MALWAIRGGAGLVLLLTLLTGSWLSGSEAQQSRPAKAPQGTARKAGGQSRPESRQEEKLATWAQWRGPSRDGRIAGPAWPASLAESHLAKVWQTPLEPGYSGPIVSEKLVFVTETKEKQTEVVRAFDRRTGAERWTASWPGAISVPFYAKSRGDWIRSTPAFDGETLFVAGMRDVVVALDGATGKERWRIDFVATYGTSVPDFGLICSPLVDGDHLYVQAANSTIKIDKRTGKILWRAFEGRYGVMSEGAFSSPIMATIGGKRQLVVQSREVLAGIDPAGWAGSLADAGGLFPGDEHPHTRRLWRRGLYQQLSESELALRHHPDRREVPGGGELEQQRLWLYVDPGDHRRVCLPPSRQPAIHLHRSADWGSDLDFHPVWEVRQSGRPGGSNSRS